MAALQAALLAYMRWANLLQITTPAKDFGIIAASSLSVLCFFGLLGYAASRHGSLRILLNVSAVALYSLLWIFFSKSHHPLYFSLLYENWNEIFNAEALQMLAGLAQPALYLSLGALFLGCFIYEAMTKRLFRLPDATNSRLVVAVLAATYLGLLVFYPANLDPGAKLASTTFHHWMVHYTKIALASHPDSYPYYDASKDTPNSPSSNDLPHVFIVQLESFNANFAFARTPDGREYTPFFNALSRRGLSAAHFYGPTVQTSRAQFVIHCGLNGSFKGKVFVDYADRTFRCLPEILREAGYQTLYFKAYKDIDFDNSRTFMAKNGFDITKGMDGEFVGPDDAPFIWGWGLQDNIFYNKFFKYLDSLEVTAPGGRYFSSLMSITSHGNFKYTPLLLRQLYAHPASRIEEYANAIYLTDAYLGEFFKNLEKRPYLKNSLVVVTGDHSFPLGEHKNFDNEVGFYDESFRTPVAIVWPAHLKPHREEVIAYSQLDLAPTILDALGLGGRNHFSGVSMLKQPRLQHVIPLIQPYNGIYLGNVMWPYKYGRKIDTGEEFLFDLAADPQEETNRLQDPTLAGVLEARRNDLEIIYQNQALIERDRVWPAHLGSLANKSTRVSSYQK